MDSVPCGVQAVTISLAESRKLRATALKVLERTLDEIARNDLIMSGGERVLRGLEPEQLYAICGAGGSHRDVVCGYLREIPGCACASSKTVVVLVLLQ